MTDIIKNTKSLESIAGVESASIPQTKEDFKEPAKEAAKEEKKEASTSPAQQKLLELQAEALALELEERKLSVQLKKAELEDAQSRLDDRKLKKENVGQTAKTNGQTLLDTAKRERQSQERCNHRKGGNGLNAYVGGQGQDSMYALMKHQFCNGDIWIRCMRCGKTWKPPVESQYLNNAEFQLAKMEYQRALDFPTNNTGSTSAQFRFSDNGQFYREQTASSTMR